MVFKISKLHARKKVYSSSESDSSVVFSESSAESLPVLKPQTEVQQSAKPSSDEGFFKSPLRRKSPKLEVNKKKIVCTYGTKFVPWESTASSTPLAEKPANMKLIPFSPINSIPSPSESPVEEQENSNDWCTYATEPEKSPNKRLSRQLHGSTQNKSLTAAGKKVLPVKSVSPKARTMIQDENEILVNKSVHDKSGTRKDCSGKQPIANIRNSVRLLSVSYKLQLDDHEATLKNAGDNHANSKIDKKEEIVHKTKVNNNLQEIQNRISEVHEKRVTRQSKIPVEWISKDKVSSWIENCEEIENFSENEVRKNVETIKENGVGVADIETISNHTSITSPKKSQILKNKRVSKGDHNVETEVDLTREVAQKKQMRIEELYEDVSRPITADSDVPQKNHKDMENLDSAPSKNTRRRYKDSKKAEVIGGTKHRQATKSESTSAVHITSENSEEKEASVNSSPRKKIKEVTFKDISVKDKESRSVITRASPKRVDIGSVSPVSKISQKSKRNLEHLKLVPSINTRRKHMEMLEVENTEHEHESDSDTSAAVPVISETPGRKRGNLPTSPQEKSKEVTIINKSVEDKGSRSSVKRMSPEPVDSHTSSVVPVTSESPWKKRGNLRTSFRKKSKEATFINKNIDDKEPRSKVKRMSTEPVDTGVRKSKRQRLAPLQYWKGERVHYEPIEHPECKTICKIVGVVRPRVQEARKEKVNTVPDDENKKKRLARNYKKKVDHNEDVLSLSKSISSTDNVRERIPLRLGSVTKDVECVAHFSKTAFEPFVLGSGRFNDGVQYQACLSVSGLTNGILKIAAGARLQNEVNKDEDLLLFVVKGRVNFTVNDHVVHARPGSSIIVPRGIKYAVENISLSETLLSYVTKT